MNYKLLLKKILVFPFRQLKELLYNFKYKKQISKIYKRNLIWSAQIGIVDDIGVKRGLQMSDTIINSITNAFKINLKYN